MKTAVRALLIVCLLAGALLFSAAPAKADDRIEVTVSFNTTTAGPRGGTINMNIRINNPTELNIDSIDFRVTTTDPFYLHWTGDDGVPPWCFRHAAFDVYFAPEDLDKDLILQLALNYDSDANPEDVKMQTFRINSIDEVISIAATSDPAGGPYIVGDTVFATHRLTNNSDYRVEDIVVQCLLTNESGTRIADSGPANMEGLDGGLSLGVPLGAELSAADRDFVEASYALAYTYLGQRYAVTDTTLHLPVMHPDFTAELSPPTCTIAPSTEQAINLRLTNTGNAGFGSFGIESHLGAFMADAGALGTGESMDVTIPIVYTEIGEFELSCQITGNFGYGDHTEESNAITIVCEAPEEEEPEATAAAEPTQEPAPTAAATPEVTIEDEGETAPTDEEPAEPADVQNNADVQDNLWLYIIIAALGALVLAAAIAIPIIIAKKKRRDDESKRDNTL